MGFHILQTNLWICYFHSNQENGGMLYNEVRQTLLLGAGECKHLITFTNFTSAKHSCGRVQARSSLSKIPPTPHPNWKQHQHVIHLQLVQVMSFTLTVLLFGFQSCCFAWQGGLSPLQNKFLISCLVISSKVLQLNFYCILTNHFCSLKQPLFPPIFFFFFFLQCRNTESHRSEVKNWNKRPHRIPEVSYQFRLQLVFAISMPKAPISSLSPRKEVSCSSNTCTVCSTSSDVNHFYTSQRFNYTRTITRAEMKTLFDTPFAIDNSHKPTYEELCKMSTRTFYCLLLFHINIIKIYVKLFIEKNFRGL